MSSNIADIGAGSAAKLEARAVPTVEAESPSVRAVTLRLHGTWNTFAADVADKRLRAVDVKHAQGVIIDTSGIEILDTAGAWLLDRYARELRSNGVTVDIETTRRRHDTLLQAVSSLAEPSEDNSGRKRSKGAVNGALSAIGSLVYALRRDALMGLHILGAAISGPQLKAGRPNRMSWAPLIAQIEQTGVRAIPIIMLMSFIIGA
ncbi:MAG: STAS domain-containing protein, partial [Pseudomonadota bacterium]